MKTYLAFWSKKETLTLEGGSMMRRKAKLMWCVVAIIGLVTATGAQAALFEDDFESDLSKWTLSGGSTPPNDVIECVDVDGDTDLGVHFYAHAPDGSRVINKLTTGVTVPEVHTLTVDFRKPSTEMGTYSFNIRHGDPDPDISYFIGWHDDNSWLSVGA
ncbi:MAG: hypothetical protein SVV80_11945 [Planctomycetota bacterium]|nr:hypothetical protein [Planctomycetota bacterium]